MALRDLPCWLVSLFILLISTGCAISKNSPGKISTVAVNSVRAPTSEEASLTLASQQFALPVRLQSHARELASQRVVTPIEFTEEDPADGPEVEPSDSESRSKPAESDDDERDDLQNGLSQDGTTDFSPAERELECKNEHPLLLQDVLTTVASSYPLLQVALAELDTADGNALASWGSFDTVLSGYSTSKPLGFYETYQHGVKVSRPLWNGSEVYGGYRLGRGNFEPWYKERETNEGGEFKTGIKTPLLKNAQIDRRRADVQVARLERDRLDPDIRTRLLDMQLTASRLYWKWVAEGQAVRTQRRLLRLADDRADNIRIQVTEGDLPRIAEIDNGRFIAKRTTKLIETRRKLQEAAIKLSLFYRDATGQPVVADELFLPCDFPEVTSIDPSQVESDIIRSLSTRPELLELDFQRQQANVELCYAQNLCLPKLDAFAEAGQDIGAPASSSRDKSPFELEAGLLAEVPLQRREAAGKTRAVEGKLAQIAAKRRFTEDKIRSQVLDAVSALRFADEGIVQARENVRLTEQSLKLGRQQFDEGDIDLIQLNIYESSLAEAELLLIEANLTYFNAMADYRASLAIDDLY